MKNITAGSMINRLAVWLAIVCLIAGTNAGFAQEKSELFDGLDIPPGSKAGTTAMPSTVSGGRSPASVTVGAQITFQVRLSNPGSVREVELVFSDANVSESMDRIGGDTWRKVRAMTGAGSNRPFQIRITASNGQKISGGSGTYSVTQASAATPSPAQQLPSSAGASATPSSVSMNGQITFEARINNPGSVQKVELVFADANVSEPMDKVGTDTWRKARTMSGAGTNRLYQIRVTASNGQQISGGSGVYSVVIPPGDLARGQPIPAGASATPSSVSMNGQITFEARINNPGSVQKVELVFTDANVSELMDKVGTDTWRKARTMSGAGTNRPYQIRITASNGQQIAGGGGVYSVAQSSVPVQGGSGQNALQAWQQKVVAFANDHIGKPWRCYPNDNPSGTYITSCYNFARTAVGQSSQGGSAWAAFSALKSAGKTSTGSFESAPIGSMIFYKIGAYGHAVIKVSATEVVGHGNELNWPKSCPPITKVLHSSLSRASYAGYFASGEGASSINVNPNEILPEERVARIKFLQDLVGQIPAANSLSGGVEQKAAVLGLIQSASLSNPQNAITRYEAGVMVLRAIRSTNPNALSGLPTAQPFADALANTEQRTETTLLRARGLFQGQFNENDGKTYFNPDKQLSGDELAVVLGRAVPFFGKAAVSTQPSPSSAGASANPSVVNVNGHISFEAKINNPGSVQKVELVFPDANNLSEPMDKIGTNVWRKARTMTGAGTNRPFQIRIISSSGQVIAGGSGTYTVQGPTSPSPSGLSSDPSNLWQKWQSGQVAIKRAELRDGKASSLSPAEIVYFSSIENNFNPISTLAKLQGEQSLVTKRYSGDELVNRLGAATGYGVRRGDRSWRGFFPQTVGLTYQFDKFSKEGKSFVDAYDTYTQDSAGPFSQFQTIYEDYAQRMNRIAGKQYLARPDSNGYFRNFQDVTPQQMQQLLSELGGTLGDANLFRGGGQVYRPDGPINIPQPSPVPLPQVNKCPDGTSVPFGQSCPQPLTVCPDGSTVPAGQACTPQMTSCPDGSSVPVGQSCSQPMTRCPDGSMVSSGQQCMQAQVASITNVSVGVSSAVPVLGSRVAVNLFGTLSSTTPSDIYLYMKKADTGEISFWHTRQFNEFPKPWRAGVTGPNLPEANPIFEFDVLQPGSYAAGVLVVPAGSPFNLSTAKEQALTVR